MSCPFRRRNRNSNLCFWSGLLERFSLLPSSDALADEDSASVVAPGHQPSFTASTASWLSQITLQISEFTDRLQGEHRAKHRYTFTLRLR